MRHCTLLLRSGVGYPRGQSCAVDFEYGVQLLGYTLCGAEVGPEIRFRSAEIGLVEIGR
jgi:hypothetical protein